MKYAGNITILDDQGEAVYDRNLTAEEMIDYLLNAIGNPPVTEPEVQPEPSAPVSKFREGMKKAAALPDTSRKQNSCGNCGLPGHSRRTCPGKSPEDTKEPAPYKGDTKGEVLTEEQFDQVMDAKENDLRFSSLQFANELGVDMREVNRAIITRKWDAYLVSYRTSS